MLSGLPVYCNAFTRPVRESHTRVTLGVLWGPDSFHFYYGILQKPSHTQAPALGSTHFLV